MTIQSDGSEPALSTELRLSNQQNALRMALEQVDGNLTRIYCGCIQILQSNNIDKFAFAAHGFRELVEKIPILALGMKPERVQITPEVRTLCDKWNVMKGKTTCFAGGKWHGIDRYIEEFWADMDSFFSWFTQHIPRNRERIANFLCKVDPRCQPLPENLATLNVRVVTEMSGYFTSVAHGHAVDTNDFLQHVDEFERFFLERLKPRAFDDMAEIEAVIDEGATP